MKKAVIDAELFVERLLKLAHQYPGQPVAVFEDKKGGVQVGVMSLREPIANDWCLLPVPLAALSTPEQHKSES